MISQWQPLLREIPPMMFSSGFPPPFCFFPVFFGGLCFSLLCLKIQPLAALSDYSVLLGDLFCSPLPFPLASTRNTGLHIMGVPLGYLIFQKLHILALLAHSTCISNSFQKWQGLPYVPEKHRVSQSSMCWETGFHSRCVINELCDLR